MSASNTRLSHFSVRTAGRAGSHRPSQDRIFTTPDAVIVLDGASQPEPDDRDGGWYADVLGEALHRALSDQPDVDLQQVLEDAIRSITVQYDLQPGSCPSSTVSMVRWRECLDVLVLGDSPVVALTSDAQIRMVRDDRLRDVGRSERNQLANAAGFSADNPDGWRRLVGVERAARNRADGYWIAEAVPAAAAYAQRARWDLDDLVAVLSMTDGVSAGVDRYGVPVDWPTAFAIATPDPARLVNLVYAAETEDADGARWRRSKRHDDKAVALVTFTPSVTSASE